VTVSSEPKDYLAHYGILRRSGRYPWGSGGSQTTRNRSFLDTIDMLRKQGMSDTEICKMYSTDKYPFTTTDLRAATTIANNQIKQEKISQAQRLKDKGWSNVAIGERMGINESSVRALLAPGEKDKVDVLTSTADMLKRQVAEKKYVDIGSGVEMELPLGEPHSPIGISSTKFNVAVAMLKEEGYQVHTIPVEQLGTGKQTKVKVLAPPGTTWGDVAKNKGQIQQISEHSDTGGRKWDKDQPYPPMNINSKRVGIKYAEDGGTAADGVIYVRPGVKDLSMGESRYAQVRIAVDGTHYLKGMAIYKDDLPDGIDLQFNTNKSDTGRKKDAMKEMEKDITGKIDPMNPFGASIKRQSGALNIINEEGNWDKWSRNLSSQVLSKQHPSLAKNQLNMTYEKRQTEFDQIMALTNPTVRKKLLETFADKTDSASVHLKAAALPRQATKVLFPVTSLKPGEIHAPTFNNGETVALIRFPHGGTFEIPQLKVNNRNREARNLLGSNTVDAIGIHPKVAERLSGADFDGDYVLVIPNARGTIKSTPALEGLKGFDPRASFPAYKGMVPIESSRKHQEMGNVTNLIADMTIRGASDEEVARAIRHSMVVIDSEKHNLDWKRSAAVNGIAQLKEKYQKEPLGQTRGPGGASTLITRAGSTEYIPQRKARPSAQGGPIDPVTGKKVYVPTGRTYEDKQGRVKVKKQTIEKLANTDDAHTLSSGSPVEFVYAEHSNKLKALANTARKEAVTTKSTPYSKSAKAAYSNEVASLNAKLNIAKKNRPRERQAQVLANTIYSQKLQANPNLDDADKKKVKNQALQEARYRTGAHKDRIKPTQAEWDAIQAGAISKSKLEDILNNADLDTIKKLATPKQEVLMTSTKRLRAKAMLDSGYTQAEVANALGVSLTTLKTSISEG
jgi:hypothetical protein